jgi:hypothetical protein
MNTPRQPSYDLDSLVNDLAKGLRPPAEILKLHGVTKAEAEALAYSPEFMRLVAAKRREWMSQDRTDDRIVAKAKLALEKALEDLYKIAGDATIPAAARVAAASQLRELAGFHKTAGDTGGGASLPSITINIGPRQVAVSGAMKDVTPAEGQPNG